MKQYDKIKTVQLIIYIVLTVSALVIIFTNEDLYHLIATNSDVKMFFILLWVLLATAFLFMFVDFSSYSTLKREYSELDLAIFSDPITGIANRHSCDAFIEKYLDKPLPKGIGCVTFDIINLRDVNSEFGHVAGNTLIRDFSGILQSSAVNLCFVGRNGGNKFLALFQDCSEEKIDELLANLEGKVNKYNEKAKKGEIKYKYGIAFDESEEVKSINQLIALSNRRAIESYRTFVDH